MVKALSRARSMLAFLILISILCLSTSVVRRSSTQAYPPLNLYDPYYGVVAPLMPRAESKLAVATFLSHDPYQEWEESNVENDQAYIGARILAYQLLHNNDTKIRDPAVSFVVLVTPTVSQAKRAQLLLDGCELINVDTPPLPQWLPSSQVLNAVDHFAKLKLFSLTQYQRILYLSPTTFLTQPIDTIFHDSMLRFPSTTLAMARPRELKQDEAPLPAGYFFAARTDNTLMNKNSPYTHAYPSMPTEDFGTFTLLLAPSQELYRYITSALRSKHSRAHIKSFLRRKYRNKWTRNIGPEHALLNYVFRRTGTMPWQELGPQWSSNWANQKDMQERVVSMHGEYWWSGPIPVREHWVELKGRMEAEFA